MQSHSLTKISLQLRLGLIELKNSGVMLSAADTVAHVSPLTAPYTLLQATFLNPTAKQVQKDCHTDFEQDCENYLISQTKNQHMLSLAASSLFLVLFC